MRAWLLVLCSLARATRGRELDPAACGARFDVQHDKIIRTEESREMGARYLAELDVGARAECLRLCCETDACDVFVFEEKSPGSCYLFNCGPPEDFRCKFTAHGNFSSGVMALSRRLAELQDQERLSHHERELATLRAATSTTSSSPAPPPALPHAPQVPHVQQATQPARQLPKHQQLSPVPQQSVQPPRRCSRYQFECRRGGECIAVYNACDGIPQCADGSDEAPELGCPPSAPAAPAPRPSTPAAPSPTPPPTQPAPQPPAPAIQEGVEEMEGGALWPRRLAQAQPQHRYSVSSVAGAGGREGGGLNEGDAPHIFSHKGGLLQPAAAWPRRAWSADNTHPDADNIDVMGNMNMGGAGGVSGWGYGRMEPWPDERRAWPVPRTEPELPVFMPPKTMPELPMVYSGQQQTLRDAPKKGFELLNKVPLLEPATHPPPDLREETKPDFTENTTKKKALKDKLNVAQTVEDDSLVSAVQSPNSGLVANTLTAGRDTGRGAEHEPYVAHWAADEHDGLSEHPPAAMFLLVLGLVMTVTLGGFLACRARAARRRRRAHPRLALDADYLVNGMYL